ncbi:hypothetical protein J6590_094993 [Homalodisca vitripennis]|nr:hypothetical protein J6590_094993 [Homalodisca vitripennis]
MTATLRRDGRGGVDTEGRTPPPNTTNNLGDTQTPHHSNTVVRRCFSSAVCSYCNTEPVDWRMRRSDTLLKNIT